MLALDFVLDAQWNSRVPQFDIGAAQEIDLRYGCVFGDVVFKDAKADLSTHWGWVPLLDFAACLQNVLLLAASQRSGVTDFEFTESEAKINFSWRNERISIKGSYSEGRIDVSVKELSSSAGVFTAKVIDAALQLYPALKHNTAFQRLFRLGSAAA
jgi:hypothetical protein